ncbi:MAG: hypothetical protein KAX49_00800 [Halanaerobiales bacterium]|nr:hypothetical protein [Halanaerobiales bacterium]
MTEKDFITKNELYDRIESALGKINNTINGNYFQLPFIKKDKTKFDELTNECIELQIELYKSSDDALELLELKKKVVSLENQVEQKVRPLASVRFLLSFSLILVFVILPLVMLLNSLNLPLMIQESFDIEELDKTIVLGIAGACVYFATSLLSKLDDKSLINKRISGTIKFILRLSLAIVVPFVLIMILFNPDGTVGEVATPELLSFACGYSVKLVIDILNKLVEKGSKIIEVI